MNEMIFKTIIKISYVKNTGNNQCWEKCDLKKKLHVGMPISLSMENNTEVSQKTKVKAFMT